MKHQNPASLAFVSTGDQWISHKGPVRRKLFPFDNVIMDTFRIHINHNGTDMWKMRNVLRDDFTTQDTEWDELV